MSGQTASRTIGIFLIFIAGLIILTAIGVWKLGTWIGFFLVYQWIFNLATDFGINHNLARVAAIILGLTVWFGSFCLFRRKLLAGAAVILLLIILQSSFMYLADRNRYFDPQTGEPTRFFTLNPISEKIELYEKRAYDKFGQRSTTVDSNTAIQIERRKLLSRNTDEEVFPEDTSKLFEPTTGEPLLYYYTDINGRIHLFPRKGFDRFTGNQLKPITSELAQKILNQPKTITFVEDWPDGQKVPATWFSGEFNIFDGQNVLDSGKIVNGVGKFTWWRTGKRIKIQYWKEGGYVYESNRFTLTGGKWIVVKMIKRR